MSDVRRPRVLGLITAAGLAIATTLAGMTVPAVAGSSQPVSSGGSATNPAGSLVLIGGPILSNRPIIREIIDRAGGQGVARIGVVTAGSVPPANEQEAADDSLDNSVSDGRRYASLFQKFGAASTYQVPIDTSASGEWAGDTYGVGRADDPRVLARVSHLTGFFFAEGDVLLYVAALQACTAGSCSDSPVLAGIRQRLADGAVVAGSSAGATILQGSPMVVSGESWDGWAQGVQDDDFPVPLGVVVRDEGGFGFFNSGVLDTDVTARGRQGRLIRIAMARNRSYAFGVDAGTALVVQGLGTSSPLISIVGDGGVHVLDLSQATFTTRWVRGVRWSWLRSGDGYNLKTHLVVMRPARESVPQPHQTPDLSVGDVWSVHSKAAGRMTQLGVDLTRSGKSTARGVTLQQSPGFEVLLTDDGLSHTWQSKRGDVNRAFVNLLLSVQRL